MTWSLIGALQTSIRFVAFAFGDKDAQVMRGVLAEDTSSGRPGAGSCFGTDCTCDRRGVRKIRRGTRSGLLRLHR